MKLKNLTIIFAFACAGWALYNNHEFKKEHKKLEEAAHDWLGYSRESLQSLEELEESGNRLKEITRIQDKRATHRWHKDIASIVCVLTVLSLCQTSSSPKNTPLDLEL